MAMSELKTVSVRDAARALKVTLKYIYDLLYSGRLPARKAGKQWRIPAEAVEARLKQRSEQ